MNRPSLPFLCAIVGCLLAGCAGPKAASPGGAASGGKAGQTLVGLEGTPWVLEQLPGRPTLVGERPTARFASGQVSGTDGCNRYAAPFTATGSNLTIGANGAMTQMACPPEVMAQAEAFMAALRGARQYRIADGRLELLSPAGTVLVAMTAQSTSVVGTWDVIAYNNGRQAVVGVLEQAHIDVTFSAEHTVTGSAGCNRFNASFEADGSTMRIGPASATRRACPGEEVMAQETAFLKALQSVATMRLEGDTLELRTADDALALMLRRAPAR